jgi:hypothetical protein
MFIFTKIISMERENKVNVFESDKMSEIQFILKKLQVLGINSEFDEKMDDENYFLHYTILVDLKDEQNAFSFIDEYLRNKGV